MKKYLAFALALIMALALRFEHILFILRKASVVNAFTDFSH